MALSKKLDRLGLKSTAEFEAYCRNVLGYTDLKRSRKVITERLNHLLRYVNTEKMSDIAFQFELDWQIGSSYYTPKKHLTIRGFDFWTHFFGSPQLAPILKMSSELVENLVWVKEELFTCYGCLTTGQLIYIDGFDHSYLEGTSVRHYIERAGYEINLVQP